VTQKSSGFVMHSDEQKYQNKIPFDFGLTPWADAIKKFTPSLGIPNLRV